MRNAAPDLPDPVEIEVLHRVLRGAVLEHRWRTDDLRADPRVGLGVDELEIGNALQLAEGSMEGRTEEEGYSHEDIHVVTFIRST